MCDFNFSKRRTFLVVLCALVECTCKTNTKSVIKERFVTYSHSAGVVGADYRKSV